MATLSDAAGRVLDRLYLPAIPAGVSDGRTLGAGGFRTLTHAPTPGAPDGAGFPGYSQAPSFAVASGLYEGKLEASIQAEPGVTVRYTTDGSIPTVDNGEI